MGKEYNIKLVLICVVMLIMPQIKLKTRMQYNEVIMI